MKISNIKCSLTIKTDYKWRNKIKSKCCENNISFVTRGNITIIKCGFSVCIIQKKYKNDCLPILHINLTGIKDFSVIQKCKKFLFDNILDPSWQEQDFRVDNICATFSFPQKINLQHLYHIFELSRFNRERFPAVFLKHVCGTVLVFESGKINILGCKSVNQIKQVWKQTLPYLLSASISTL